MPSGYQRPHRTHSVGWKIKVGFCFLKNMSEVQVLHQRYSPAVMAWLKGVGGEPDLRSVQQLLPRALPKRNMLSFWVFSVWWCIYLLHIQNLLTSLQSSFVQLVFIRKSNHLTVPSSPQDKKVYGSFGTVIICRQKQKDKNMRHQPPPHQVNCKQRHGWHRETLPIPLCGFYFLLTALFT